MTKKKIITLSLSLLLVAVVTLTAVVMFRDQQAMKKAQQQVAKTEAEAATKNNQTKVEDLKKALAEGINYLNGYQAQDRSTVTAISAEVGIFSGYGQQINQAKRQDDQELKQLASELEGKLKAKQTEQFPLIRKQYGEALGRSLQVVNITTAVAGEGNGTLKLTGDSFADGNKIKDMQASLAVMMEILRFKRVEYYWPNNTTGQIYTLDQVKADSEL